MPIVNYQTYCHMLENARLQKFAYPAINVTSIPTANAALKGFADAKSDGIIQVSTGGGEFASGLYVKDMVEGAISIVEHVQRVAYKYPVNIALHTDHCPPDKIDSFLLPLIEETEKRRREGRANLFSSHMFDGSSLPLQENLAISVKLLERCYRSEIILEVEAGVVGGEEDGINNEDVIEEKLYTTPEDMVEVYRSLSEVADAKFMLAATFGNVHGVYKPGNVKLRPKILQEGQLAIAKEFGDKAFFYLVFHGGSGSSEADIFETLQYGVIKMNIDTDTQYAFTRAIADHMLKNYDGVLRIDGEVGNKGSYDPRSYLKKGEAAMASKVIEYINFLRSNGKTLRD